MRFDFRQFKRIRFVNLWSLLNVALLVVFGFTLAEAQQQPGYYPVTQSPTRLDSASFLISNSATNCTTVSQTAVQDTLTIPPGPGSIYISSFSYHVSMDATGVTQTGTIAASNITGSPVWDFNSALSTTGTGSFGVSEAYATGLKSAQPGVAVVFTPSATQSAHNYLCMRVAGWYAP